MKSVITAAVMTTAFFLASCGNTDNDKSNSNATEQVETAMYQCPMKCEGDKMYAEKGTCPICKMDLELVAKEENHKLHNH